VVVVEFRAARDSQRFRQLPEAQAAVEADLMLLILKTARQEIRLALRHRKETMAGTDLEAMLTQTPNLPVVVVVRLL
jgi:hypothetical protein